MNNTKMIFGFLLFVLSLSLMTCKGKEGDVGPVGPTGEMGLPGVDGEKGEQGEIGVEGNANVFSSDWAEITFSPASGAFGVFDMFAPEIDADVLDKALVLGYIKVGSFVFGLPKVWQTPNQIFDASFTLETYRFQYFTTTTWTPPTMIEGRYVIVPPAGRIAAEGSPNPKAAILQEFMEAGVDVEDYDQVAKFLNLK